MDPVFASCARAAGVDPYEAVRHGLDPAQIRRLKREGLERVEIEIVRGERTIRTLIILLTPQMEYSYSREVVGDDGRKPGGAVLKIMRSGFPVTVMATMAGQHVGHYVQHPHLPRDLVITDMSDLRPNFDVVTLWLGEQATDEHANNHQEDMP